MAPSQVRECTSAYLHLGFEPAASGQWSSGNMPCGLTKVGKWVLLAWQGLPVFKDLRDQGVLKMRVYVVHLFC